MSGTQAYIVLLLIKLAYDIACQYMVHLLSRLANIQTIVPLLSSISTAKLPLIHGSVGKFHVFGHTQTCRTFQSPNFMPGNGNSDGEGSEREWEKLNPTAAATQEMTPGHRHDTLNSNMSDLNLRQVTKMRELLPVKRAECGRVLMQCSHMISTDA